MKPLFPIVVAILVLAANAHPENIQDVKELPQSKEPVVEAEASEPQARTERCSACSGTLNLKSPKELLGQLKLPNTQVHTQETFEGCSTEKGCAGLKVKDGKILEKFGNIQAFNAAITADTGNEFEFHSAGNSVFEGGVPNGGPFWWMNQDSPFKAGAAGNGGSFEKFSKSSSSFTSSSNTGAGGDLGANPFLNGDFSKLSPNAGFSDAGGNFASTQTFKSTTAKEVDISNNPFLNGGFSGQSGFGSGSQNAFGSNSQSGFGAQGSQTGFGVQGGQTGFGAQGGKIGVGSQGNQNAFGSAQGSQSAFGSAFNSGSKFNSGSGYIGSSPAPFAPAAGANVNLIQNSQKKEFDFEQQQQTQQNIDEIFRNTGNVNAHDNSGGDLQQTCAGQGYVCVHKAQCNNGVVNTNGGGLLQANTQKQYCNTRTEICCRIETASLAGNGNLQGSLGVGSATFQGNSNQGQGLFSQSGSSQGSQNSFGSSGFGTGFNANKGSSSTGFGSQFGSSGSGSSFNSNKFGSTASGIGSSTPTSFGVNTGNFNNEVFKSTSQSNFVETDSFSSGSENVGVFRPGASGTGLKPGIPYLPPDTSTSGSNVVSTIYTPSFVTTPRPISTPRPVISPRPFTSPRPTYLPPSTKAPEYLPPVDGITGSDSFQNPHYIDGQLILDETLPPRPVRPPPPPQNVEIPSGCAAALKCTPIEYCTAEGVISNTTVALTRDQQAYRVPLTDCKHLESGRIGKCCRDPFYTDPWPANQIGQWVPGVFGGNDGKYVPDSRGSANNQPGVTVRPPVTGSVYLNNFRTTKTPQGPNQVTAGYPSSTTPSPGFIEKNQYGQGSYSTGGRGSYSTGGQGQVQIQGQGQYGLAGQGNQGAGGQYAQGSSYSQTSQGFGQGGGGQAVIRGQGSYTTGGQGTQVTQGGGTLVSQGVGTGIRQGQGFGVTQSQGVGVNRGQGFAVTGGGGQYTTQGQGTAISQGSGFGVQQGTGFGVQQGGGFGVQQGGGFGVSQGGGYGIQQGQGQTIIRGQGQKLIQGQGEKITQGIVTGVRQGQGFSVSQNGGYQIENEFGESVQRVYLPRYSYGSGECGVLNPMKPFGNRKELEVDFAEISWQAMILLATNKSLLCGGVITRPDVVITSASCIDGLKTDNILIKGGEWKLAIDEEPLPFQIVKVKNVLRHPLYKPGDSTNDVAILVLAENLRLAKNIWPICLPSSTDTLDAFYNGAGQCIVTGWGKSVLRAHLLGSIMHSMNVSLLNPGECQSKITSDYPHLLEHYDKDTCICGQPTNPANDICKVDTGSALACTTGDNHFVLRGIYTTESGCQPGNQLATFFKFDLEWYEWAIGLTESVRFNQYLITKVTKNKIITQVSGTKGTFGSGIKGSYGVGIKGTTGSGIQGSVSSGATGISGSGVGVIKGFGVQGQGQSGQFSQFGSGSTGGISGSVTSGGSAISGSGVGVIKGFGVKGQGQSGQFSQFGSGSTGGISGSVTSGGSAISGSGVGVIKGFGVQGQGQSGQFSQFGSGSTGGLSGSVTSGGSTISGSGVGVTKGFGVQGQGQSGQFSQFGSGSTGGLSGSVTSGGSTISGSGVGVTKGFGVQGQGQSGQFSQFGSGSSGSSAISGSGVGVIKGFGVQGQGQSGQFSQFGSGTGEFGAEIKGPIQNTFSATFSEKKFFQSEPKYVTYTTKPEIVTFTTKPEYFTYTTKPKYVTYTTKPEIVTYTTKPEIVTYTTKPEIITYTTKPEIVTYTTKPKIVTYTTKPQIIRYDYQTSGSQTNQQVVAPSVSFNPSFSEVVGAKHIHDSTCKCLEGK